jgi:hypothetical protein
MRAAGWLTRQPSKTLVSPPLPWSPQHLIASPCSLGDLPPHPCPPLTPALLPSALAARNLFDYDQVVNTQRDKIYAERRKALLAPDLVALMREYAEKTADDILEVGATGEGRTGMGCAR